MPVDTFPVQEIPIGKITRGENSRLFVRPIDDLAASIGASGLISPLLVAKERRHFELIAGFRRFEAIAKIREREPRRFAKIRCAIFEGDDAARRIANLEENRGRENLTTWELANQIVLLEERYGLDPDELAKRLGYSESHLRNLARLARKIHPTIRTALDRGSELLDPRVFTTTNLLYWAGLPHEKQIWRYEECLGSQGKSGTRPKPSNWISPRKASAMLVRLEKAVEADPNLRPALQTLRWAMGLEPTPPIPIGK